MVDSQRVERFGGTGTGVLLLTLWHVAALLVVMLVPSLLRLGLPFWRLPPEQAMQVPVMGAAYLALVLFLPSRLGHLKGLLATMAVMLACFGSAYLVMRMRPDMQHSRLLLLFSAILGTLLALLPQLLPRQLPAGTAVLVLSSLALVAIGFGTPKPEPREPLPESGVKVTALNSLLVTYLRRVVDPVKSDGGALARWGEGFLLVTGSGEFYRLDWKPDGNALVARRLPLPAPMDRESFLADQQRGKDSKRFRDTKLRFRVTDVALDTSGDIARVYVAHQYWHPEGKCLTMRVSVAPLPRGAVRPGDPATEWGKVFESKPCLEFQDTYDGAESGGRLAWTPKGQLLLTLGSFGLDGLIGPAPVAQAQDSDYGKVLLLESGKDATIFSMGHRNPQGLFVDRKGRIWETEHGPQGGDELNLLARGRNYGWPFMTYGTEYGRTDWPLARANDGRIFEYPVHAFTPSIAISNLIEVWPPLFAEWEGDLLVASLKAKSLFRIRLQGDRVAYVEPIGVGLRIRDIEQAKDGRIVLWTDDGQLVVLARSVKESRGERLYGMCSRCHETLTGGFAIAPSLRGIVGRAVASDRGFAYSPALAGLGGAWTRERLDAFLEAPSTYARGTAMAFAGIPDSDERKALIDYLSDYR